MKLSQWAKEQGLTYKGAWRMWKAGQLPVPAEQLPTGTIIVKEIKAPARSVPACMGAARPATKAKKAVRATEQ